MTDCEDGIFSDYNARRRYNDSMRIHRLAFCVAAVLAACAPAQPATSEPVLYVYRLDPPAFVELNADLGPVREIAFSPPAGCRLGGVYPAPRGPLMALELRCAFGPAVLWLNVESGEVHQPITNSDSHFLAWSPAGDAVYLKIDSIKSPRLVLQEVDGAQKTYDVPVLTYDLSPSPAGKEVVFALSRGLGLGSEMRLAQGSPAGARKILEDGSNYLSFARWSPDGEHVAFIKVPDSATPFTIGELWVMGKNGQGARMLAKADAGHGFPPAWSPDGRQIAFVGRENPADAFADSSDNALISNLYLADLGGTGARRISDFPGARVESPSWQPDSQVIAFSAVVDDRMAVFLQNVNTGERLQVPLESACCAGWIRK
jgi:hypothetical protein